MLHFSIWYFVLAAPFTNQLQHSISTFTRSSNDNHKSSPICLWTDPTEQFVFIFPCVLGRKEMSRVHFVVTKFPASELTLEASTLTEASTFTEASTLMGASTLIKSITLGFRSPGSSPAFSTISINKQHIIAKIINKHVSNII